MALAVWTGGGLAQAPPEPGGAPAVVDAKQVAAKKVDRSEKVLDAFVQALSADKSVADALRSDLLKEIATHRSDADRRSTLVTETLAAYVPDFRAALLDLADEKYDAATKKLVKLVESPNPYLKSEAAFYLARTYLANQQPEHALPLLTKATGEWADHNMSLAESQYLLGASQAQLLDRVAAIKSLMKFVDEHPQASERLLVSAVRQIEELAAIEREKGRMLDIEDRMGFSKRKLEGADSGDRTRTEQDRIVAMLDVLIKEAEDREQGGS